MRIIVADCSAVYTGRGDTKLKRAVRAIIIKQDGAISIHNDAGNKPLNYMAKGNILSEEYEDEVLVWKFDTRKENLTIHLHSVISDSEHLLVTDDEGLVRDGTEDHLQAWVAENPHVLGEGFTLVQREFNTGAGAVDILVKDSFGDYVSVEIKRTAMLPSVDQARRYSTALKEIEEYQNVRPMLAAIDIRPKTLLMAEKKGVECVVLAEQWKNRPQDDTFLNAELSKSKEEISEANNPS